MRSGAVCVGIFLLLFVGLLASCGGSSSTSKVRMSPSASQQGTSGGVADYDGDGFDDLFVGAPYATGGTRVGAVFVYRGDGETFAETANWTLTGDDNFGYRFAVVGDLDGDGMDEYAVTALNGNGETASLCGSVTVYRGGSKGTVYAKLAGEQALDKFGYSLTGQCDLNDDGYGDLVVGAISHSPGPDRYLGGANYVYFGPELSEATRLKLGATEHTGVFGFSSACGDINDDGVDDLILSAIWTHGVRWHSSQVLGYYGGEGFAPETDEAELVIESTATHFGDGLAVLEDLNGDGYGEIAIGVPAFYAIPRPFEQHKGVVYLVKGGEGLRTVDLSTPGEALLARIYGGDYLERFGSVIASVGDLDGDKKPDFVVSSLHGDAEGATGLDTGRVTGKAYLFYGKDIPTDGTDGSATDALVLSQPERDLHYGSCLVPFTQGGAPQLLVGAPTALQLNGTVYLEPLPTPAL